MTTEPITTETRAEPVDLVRLRHRGNGVTVRVEPSLAASLIGGAWERVDTGDDD